MHVYSLGNYKLATINDEQHVGGNIEVMYFM